MRPRGMASKWVKVLPWYYTERRQPTRAMERDEALRDQQDNGAPDDLTPAREPVQCARPGCPVTFVPKSKVHEFCSVTCKRRVFAYRHVLGRK